MWGKQLPTHQDSLVCTNCIPKCPQGHVVKKIASVRRHAPRVGARSVFASLGMSYLHLFGCAILVETVLAANIAAQIVR